MTENDNNPRHNGTFAVIDNFIITGVFDTGNPMGTVRPGRGHFTSREEAQVFAEEMRARGGNPMVIEVHDWSWKHDTGPFSKNRHNS